MADATLLPSSPASMDSLASVARARTVVPKGSCVAAVNLWEFKVREGMKRAPGGSVQFSGTCTSRTL